MTNTAEAPPSALWYTKETKMASAQTPHDVVLAVADLKRMFAWVMSVLGAALIAILVNYNIRISSVEAKANTLSQVAEYAKEERARIQKSVETSISGQQQILLQVTELRPKVAAIEEISRATQVRVDALADFLRKNSTAKNEVINNYDTLRATRP